MEWRLVTSLLIGICQQGSILNKDAYIICWNVTLRKIVNEYVKC